MADTLETPENRLKRLHMRSWRRGMKEMDLILGRFADDCLSGLSGPDLDLYERMLAENDQDLYLWVTARDRRRSRPRGTADADPDAGSDRATCRDPLCGRSLKISAFLAQEEAAINRRLSFLCH